MNRNHKRKGTDTGMLSDWRGLRLPCMLFERSMLAGAGNEPVLFHDDSAGIILAEGIRMQ